METKYISRVKLVDGSQYKIKDVEAREMINNLFFNEIILDGGMAPENQETPSNEVILDGGTAPIDENN